MEHWHAAKPLSIAHGVPTASRPKAAVVPPAQYTAVFGEALVDECRRDPRVVGITAAMNSGTGLNILQKAMPERYFDVGIAEQQAVLFASGLALEGAKPVVAIYSTFLQRAYDQIVHDVCLQKLNVVFALDRAGLVGDDGPTHHGTYDIAYLRCLPNIVVMAPRDEAMLVHMLRTALTHDGGPIAIRYPRGSGPGVPLPKQPTAIEIGTGEILREPGRGYGSGPRVALLGYGSGVGRALAAADLLAEHGIPTTVADARFAKPIDAGLVVQLAAEHDLLVTVEEGVLAGGFGTAVWETLNENGAPGPQIMRIGLPDRYVTHGEPARLYEEVGFTAERIAERIRRALRRRRQARHLKRGQTRKGPPGERAFSGEESRGAVASRRSSPTRAAELCDVGHTSPSRIRLAHGQAPARRTAGRPRPVRIAQPGRGIGARRRGPDRPGRRRARPSPASSSQTTPSSTSTSGLATSRAAASSWPTRSPRAGSIPAAGGAWTSGRRPAASPTACSRPGPPTSIDARRRLRRARLVDCGQTRG